MFFFCFLLSLRFLAFFLFSCNRLYFKKEKDFLVSLSSFLAINDGTNVSSIIGI